MNQSEYLKKFKEVTEKMNELVARKNADYASEGDAFKNFKMCEALGVCSVEEGIVVRMSDKLTRVSNLLNSEAKVADEKIQDTLLDLANYSIILSLIISDKSKKK
jgi:uncharacterized membrane-anchored protein